MRNSNQILVFFLEEQGYALYLHAVERVVHAVEVMPLPKAPDIVLGIINMRGQVIPVLNIRKRFDLPERKIDPDDRFIIAHTKKRTVALVVDMVNGIIQPAKEKLVPAEKVTPGMELIDGVIKLEDGMILIHDLERFLSLEEETMLDKAVKGKKDD
ncbi:MAG TPA: chemotaxis protein CheW [archaeon]|nr:chemotaxis protein CheW [archaeon]